MSVRVEIERADWMHSPGRTAALELGPFSFFVNTADEGMVGFGISFGRFSWTWALERSEAMARR